MWRPPEVLEIPPACQCQQTMQVEVEMEVVVPPLSVPRLSFGIALHPKLQSM